MPLRLFYSRDIKSVAERKDSLTSQQALGVLRDELLGRNWYIADSVSGEEANAIVVEAILEKYAPKRRFK